MARSTIKDAQRKLPEFTLERCKKCGICAYCCPKGAIGTREDGTPYLMNPEACTSCGLCEDMCPDWAVCLSTPAGGKNDAVGGDKAP